MDVNAALRDIVHHKYGEEGVKVLTEYINNVNGIYDDTQEDLDDCSECKERAQKILELNELFNRMVDTHLNDTVDFISKKINFSDVVGNVISILDSVISETLKGLCYTINKDLKNKVILRILLELCKRIIQKDDNTTE